MGAALIITVWLGSMILVIWAAKRFGDYLEGKINSPDAEQEASVELTPAATPTAAGDFVGGRE